MKLLAKAIALAAELFNKIEGLPLLEKKYQDALVAMSTPPPASGA